MICEFLHTKNYELKKTENFLLTLWVCNVPKINLRKFSTIYRESLIFSLQNRFFFKYSYDFWLLSRGLNKRIILTLIAHNSVKNCRIGIFKKEILKTETLFYQDIFILVSKKVIAVFIDKCLLKKRNYFLVNIWYYILNYR